MQQKFISTKQDFCIFLLFNMYFFIKKFKNINYQKWTFNMSFLEEEKCLEIYLWYVFLSFPLIFNLCL